MWICTKCGREFKRTNQDHYCGKAPESVDEYLDLQPPEAHAHITELRNILHRCIPEVKERIAWSMPLFEKDGRSISFAACKSHISLYLNAEIIHIVQPQLCDFTTKKNAIYLPYDKALPVEAIEAAVSLSLKTE